MVDMKTLPPGEEDLINIDLDVKKVLDVFPKTEHDSFMYIRAHFEPKPKKNDIRCSINARGRMEPMSFGLADFMAQEQVYEDTVMNAVINYLALNQDRVAVFLKGLENAVNNYNKRKEAKNG